MTIKEAIERYTSEDELETSPALREVINVMIDANIKTEFENDSYLDALTLTNIMFSRSTRSIRMLTGPQGDGFLCALEKPLTAALDRIKANRGEVRVIVLGQPNGGLEKLQRAYPETLKVIPAQAAAPLKHFTVCDSKMARVEELHGPLTPETLASAIKARVYFSDSIKAKGLEEIFDQIWNRLQSMNAQGAAPRSTAQNEAVHAH